MRLVRSYHALGTPKQVDPSRITLVVDPTVEEADQHIRDEQEEIVRMLHRELEDVDRRVTRSRARAYNIPLRLQDTGEGSARRKSIRKGKLPIRTPRQRANEAFRLIHTPEEEEDSDPDPVGADEATYAMVIEPEFDDEGNVVADGDMLFSASSSSSSEDEFH
ncbi:hypothetical protein GOP47_0010226 [Adiantum capillus-veneris]|uniref:Uncharacterized protein n=1 Tax=Adiantum capillus-veneris TaxID=13818 RepID=A0A9D4UUB8_ADICA|nr:hypothetical protein GOP47_0010226 [Adiantum capillus-veneris]